jgi:hypothetical protein
MFFKVPDDLNYKVIMFFFKVSDDLNDIEELRDILCCPGVRALLQVNTYIHLNNICNHPE